MPITKRCIHICTALSLATAKGDEKSINISLEKAQVETACCSRSDLN